LFLTSESQVSSRQPSGLTEAQAAQAMRETRGTVKSATSRGVAALARMLKDEEAR
jgi:DNA-directed RNA polymerase specialized sigma24 family protein